MRKNKKQKINDTYDDELFLNNKQNFMNLSSNIENIKKKIEEGEKKEELYNNKMEERDLDLIERLYYENKLKYNEIWIEYLIKQINDLRNNNCKDLFDFDSDSDSDNDYDYSDMQMETKDKENIENYNRLIKKLQNKLNLEELSEAQINHKEEDNDSDDTSDEDDNLDFYEEEELEDDEMEEFIMSKNNEEEEYKKSIERIKKVMNDNKDDEDYIIGMNSLYLMLEKIIIKNKNYKKINKEWNEYYKNHIENKIFDNIIINNQKYDFFREKILNKK